MYQREGDNLQLFLMLPKKVSPGTHTLKIINSGKLCILSNSLALEIIPKLFMVPVSSIALDSTDATLFQLLILLPMNQCHMTHSPPFCMNEVLYPV